MTVPIHQHLLVKAHSTKILKDPEELKIFLESLVLLVGMKIATPPQAHYVTDPGNEGLTGTIGLSTSHASIHCFDNVPDIDGVVMFDLYSCACYDTLDVLNFFAKGFNINKLVYQVVDRDSLDTYDSRLRLD